MSAGPMVRATAWAWVSAIVVVCTLARPSRGEYADTTMLLVREAATLAGPPGEGPPDARFGAPPPPVGDVPRVPTMRDAKDAVAGVEAWIGWGWRGGALAAVYGLASDETRAVVEHAGREVIAGTARAMEIVDALVADLDRNANAAEDRDAASMLQARRTTLPLRAARAMIWIAAARGPDDPSTERLLLLGAELAGTVDATRADSAMERAVMLGQAALGARAPGGLDAALAEFARGAGMEGATVPGATRLEIDLLRAHAAWLGKDSSRASALLDEIIERSVSADGARDFGTVMVVRGTQARVVLDEGLPSRSPAVRARAISAATDLLRAELSATDTSEASPARRRGAVFEACRGIAARLSPTDPRPGLVVAAVAQGDTGAGENARDAAGALEAWLASPAAQNDPDVDEVRLALARAFALIGDGPSSARAAQLAAAFVESHPTDDRCGDVVALACAAAAQGALSGSVDDATLAAVLRQAHGAPFDVPRRDQWRVALLAVLAGDLDALPPADAVARVEEILAVAGSMGTGPEGVRGAIVGGDSAVYLAARFEHDWDLWMSAGVTPERIAALGDAAGAALTARGEGERGAGVRGEGMLVAGRFDEAWTLLGGETGSATDAQSLSVLARAAAMRGDDARARATLAALDGDDPDRARRSAAWIADKAWREVSAYRDALPEDVGDPSRARAMSAALVVAWEALGGDGGGPEVRERAGIAASVAGSWEEASRLLEPAWEANPTDVGVALALADARIGVGDDEGAFALLYAIATAREASRTLDRAYFRAWIRVVQVLASRRDDPSRVDQAKRELARVMGMEELAAFADLSARAAAIAKDLGAGAPE